MSPVPPALFKAKGTTLRADEYLRGVNPVGTVHRGPLSAFGRQECSALRTEPSVAFSRTDRLEAIRPFSLEYFLPGEGNKAYAASHAREYLARHEAEGLDRFRRPAVSEPGEPRWKTFGASGRHQDFAKTPARGGHLPLKPDWPNKQESRWGASERLHRPLDGGHDVVQYSSFAKQKLSTASSRGQHPYVNIGARTTRAERGRQTLGPRTGRALPIARRVQPRAAGSTRRGRVQAGRRSGGRSRRGGRRSRGRRSGRTPESPRRRGNPRGSRAGTGRRRCGRTRASRARGRTTRLSISGDRRRAGGARLISVRRLIRRPRRRTGGLRLPGAGRRSWGRAGKGRPARAGRTR